MHRRWWDILWEPDLARDTQWTDWDYALLEAYSTIEDMTDRNGQLLWLAESPNVYWDNDTRINHAEAELQKIGEESKMSPGETPFLYNPHTEDGSPLPTMVDWLKSLDEGTNKHEKNTPQGARPPTSAERAERRKRREAALNRTE